MKFFKTIDKMNKVYQSSNGIIQKDENMLNLEKKVQFYDFEYIT